MRDAGGEIGGEARRAVATAPASGCRQAPRRLAHRSSACSAGAPACSACSSPCSRSGFGLVLFGRPNLEVVSDTVTHSFGRAFVTGLSGQILAAPHLRHAGRRADSERRRDSAAAVRGRGLCHCSRCSRVVGGYLAVAHAMGETYTRRRMAHGRDDRVGQQLSLSAGRARRSGRVWARVGGLRVGAGGGRAWSGERPSSSPGCSPPLVSAPPC